MAHLAVLKAGIPVLKELYDFLKKEVSDAEVYAFHNDVAAVKRAIEVG